MTSYVAVITFPQDATTYQALSELKSDPVANEVVAAVLLQRDANGQLTAPEGVDAAAGSATAGGSLIGLLFGALAGPLGLLLGAGTGALTGSLMDADRADAQEAALLHLSTVIPAGRNALVLQTEEESTEPLDSFASARQGTVTRRELGEVLSELEAEEAAAEAARDAANAKLKEQRKEERHEKHEERIAKLKSKLGLD